MQWLIPIVTALWGLWTWSHEREQDRARERARLAALYVNPFLAACEDLQSRIYNIIELNGLRVLRVRYPDGTYAEETLYLMVRFFGWLATVQRYSPYTQDAEVIRLSEALRNAFATSAYPVGPFAFFRPEQRALGKMVMMRFEGQHGIELDTIPWCEFMERLESPTLATSHAVQETIQALRNAEDAERMPGRERLAEIQNHLVDLLAYVERKEGFSFFAGTRKKCETAQVSLQESPTGTVQPSL